MKRAASVRSVSPRSPPASGPRPPRRAGGGNCRSAAGEGALGGGDGQWPAGGAGGRGRKPLDRTGIALLTRDRRANEPCEGVRPRHPFAFNPLRLFEGDCVQPTRVLAVRRHRKRAARAPVGDLDTRVLHTAKQGLAELTLMALDELPRLTRAADIEAGLDPREEMKVTRALKFSLRPARDSVGGLALSFERLIDGKREQA